MLKKILQKVIGKEELSADDFKTLQAELDKLGKDNPEVVKLKEELAKAKKQLDDIETAKLSDLEKAQKQIEDLQKNIADRDGTIEGRSAPRLPRARRAGKRGGRILLPQHLPHQSSR